MPSPMAILNELVRIARRETGTWTAGDLAKLLGCSRSTVQRNLGTEGLSRGEHYEILIRTVHTKNPGLARQLAAARGTSLEELGLGPAEQLSDTTGPLHADSVVYAAADVL